MLEEEPHRYYGEGKWIFACDMMVELKDAKVFFMVSFS